MTNPNPFDDALNIVINSSPVGPNPAAVAAYHAAPSEFPDPRSASYPYPQPALDALLNELATLRADNDARGVVIADLRNAVYIANARADRQAARAERAEAETKRAKATTAVLARALRMMTKGDE